VLVLTLPTPLTVAGISQTGLDWGVLLASYLGSFLIGATFLAIGGWAGSFTANQIVAFIVGVALIFVGVMIGAPLVTFFAPGFLVTLLEYLGLHTHFESMARGVIDSRDVIYYLSVIFLFLYITVRSVENRKWS
jgi:ABC-2 type transport system permease protein